ncbi:MAG: hypothetical protein HYV51_00840 [Parcubacteria group bacterium]|nr:hypothetical protein [Parcubacteria group bacterium]
MSWWLNIIEYLKNSEDISADGNVSVKKAVTKALAESAVDLLYYIVGLFTTLYFFVAAYLFFLDAGVYNGLFIKIFDSLSEPYLGSVGIYVILKEVRKRQLKTKSKHLGEYFVFSWLILFIVAVGFVWISPNYHFDEIMGAITTITLALTVIYTGGLLHKP